MDWETYKRLCDGSRVFSRHALRLTMTVLEHDQARPLRDMLENAPLEKPADHRGGEETDCFEVALGTSLVREILAAIERNPGGNLTSSRQRHLTAIWREYLAVFDT